MPYIMWLVVVAVKWAAILIAAAVAVRAANALVAFWWPVRRELRRRRDARWLLVWLLMLAVGVALVRCQAGGFFGFRDPLGHDWSFDAHGWPLAEPSSPSDAMQKNGAAAAIYLTALVVDLAISLLLLVVARVVINRWLNAWDAPRRWPALAREAAGWCAALLAVLFGERLAARPVYLPGTNLMVYTTLLYELPEVRAGMLAGLACAAFCLGLGLVRLARTAVRLRDEGVI